VTLNISGQQSKPGSGKAPKAKAQPLVDQVVDELTSWNPREFITAFQRWHAGSVSLVHLNVLTLLEASGPMPMGRLAEQLDISVASITGVIDRMEAKGLVERRRDSEDRRVILVHPGKGGRKLFDDMGKRRRLGLTALLSKLSDEQLQGLLEGHRALRAARTEFARTAGAGKVEALRSWAKAAKAAKPSKAAKR
jgi:DNA-binding MarR family transcriptional regulator